MPESPVSGNGLSREQLMAQRDYYRRRWITRGLRYAMVDYYINSRAGRPKPEIEELARAIARDAEEAHVQA